MRKQIWIPCAVGLAFCLLLLLLRPVQHQKTALPDQNEIPANRPSQPRQAEAPQNREGANTPRSTAPPALVAPAGPIGGSNPVAAARLALWQTQIEFYGKVVDESGNAVSEADITFKWTEIPTEEGSRTSTTKSDAKGLFSMHGQRGPSLEVWVGKEGYYAPHRGQWGFNYALGPDIVSPEPQNPVIFQLRKRGAAVPLVALKRSYSISRGGTPLSIDLATGVTMIGASGDFVVQCWTEDQGKRSGERYSWRCVVTIPGGGIVPTEEEFAFLAPENGYMRSTEIAMSAARTDWRDDVDLKFFYRLADGRYGRMTFSMIAGGQHFCMINSILNPSGSRNLEPMDVKPQGRTPPPGVTEVIPEFK